MREPLLLLFFLLLFVVVVVVFFKSRFFFLLGYYGFNLFPLPQRGKCEVPLTTDLGSVSTSQGKGSSAVILCTEKLTGIHL